jgi:hypothetical protein
MTRLSHSFTTSDFLLTGSTDSTGTHLCLRVLDSHINTQSFPSTFSVLQQQIPDIFEARCFNDASLPFHEECKHTELGHLFEHIVLEFLCEEKLNTGVTEASYSGETSWDWDRDQTGTFHISITAGMSDFSFLQRALVRANAIVSTIVQADVVSA